jgi:hypothetical protein
LDESRPDVLGKRILAARVQVDTGYYVNPGAAEAVREPTDPTKHINGRDQWAATTV